ncbi:hypothetical protein O3M35_011032 [Rhynocoris fuscipes]|uniref:Uncharacterized protein n=1 Tax=Rhynocoris fuscipes TaxID=488301 RepID=A0AAW1D0Y2_9HEMI
MVGSDYPIRKWVADFEEIAENACWNDFQKLIFAKKLLKGGAKSLVKSEKGLISWLKLNNLLISEFHTEETSAHIHNLLMNRKKKEDKEETLQVYVLTMREIARRANVEAASVFEYIIDGIAVNSGSKIILYGAKSYDEFKEKIKIYSKIKSSNDQKRRKMNQNSSDSKDFVQPRCHRYGRSEHIARLKIRDIKK